jgi:GMP reductase
MDAQLEKQLNKSAIEAAEARNVSGMSTLAGSISYDQIDIHQSITDKRSRSDFDPYINIPRSDARVLPVMAANMHGIGTMDMARAGLMVALDKGTYTQDELEGFFADDPAASHTFYSMGLRKQDQEKFAGIHARLPKGAIQNICLDVPHAGMNAFFNLVSDLRKQNPDSCIMAGNTISPIITQKLLACGADIVKVGVGPGEQCTTRTTTGVSRAQLDAVIACAHAADDKGGYVCADGGIKHHGDIAKAIGVGGALFAMIGSKLGGYQEGGIVGHFDDAAIELAIKNDDAKRDEDGTIHIRLRGSSSVRAMVSNYGKQEAHQASEGRDDNFVEYKGSIQQEISDIKGHLQSTLSYQGLDTMTQARNQMTFTIR